MGQNVEEGIHIREDMNIEFTSQGRKVLKKQMQFEGGGGKALSSGEFWSFLVHESLNGVML